MRHSIAGRATVVGTTLRAVASVFSIAATGAKIRTVTVTNTVAVAFVATLVRFTNATGVGTGLTEFDYDAANPALCTGFAGHTADGAVGAALAQVTIGAAVGAGYTWVFGDSGILIPVGTANGFGIICGTGTGQICDYTIEWDE